MLRTLMDPNSDADSSRAESIRTFQMSSDGSPSSSGARQQLRGNWSRSRLVLLGCLVCGLAAAVAYAVYVDARISRVERDAQSQAEARARVGCARTCATAIRNMNAKVDTMESKVRRLRTQQATPAGASASLSVSDVRDEARTGLEEARQARAALEEALADVRAESESARALVTSLTRRVTEAEDRIRRQQQQQQQQQQRPGSSPASVLLFPVLKNQLDGLESRLRQGMTESRRALTSLGRDVGALRDRVANVTAVVASVEGAIAAGRGQSAQQNEQRCLRGRSSSKVLHACEKITLAGVTTLSF